jgi:hypothetical protein
VDLFDAVQVQPFPPIQSFVQVYSHHLRSAGNVSFQLKYPKIGSSGGTGFWLHILLMIALAAMHLHLQHTTEVYA